MSAQWIGIGKRLRALREARGITPAPYSKPFMEVLGLALLDGLLSARRAANLLRTTVDDLADLFIIHNLEPPAEL